MRKINLLYLLWITILIAVSVVIATQRREAPVFYGIAETRESIINAEAAVQIKRLWVVEGQFVSAGDLLVEFDRSELTMEVNKIAHELEEFETRKNIITAEIIHEIDRLSAQKAIKRSEITGRIRQLQAQYDINKEITGNLKSLGDEAGEEETPKEFSPIQIRIDRLENELDLALNEIQIRIDSLEKELTAPTSPEAIRIEGLQQEMNMLLAERNKLYIFAPVTGLVGTVHVKEGESVAPFTPVLTVHTENPSYVKGFINENVHNRIALGSPAAIIPLANGSRRVVGTVTGIGSRIVEFPERLRRRPDVQVWGREVLIKLPEDNGLLLGERVKIVESSMGLIIEPEVLFFDQSE